MWCAVAKTCWGTIPGKVHPSKPEVCIFAYYGKEYKTRNFVLVKSQNLSDKHDDKPQGLENGKKMWCAVADTPNGKICGKADEENIWYPFEGEKHQTKNFKYVLGQPEEEAKDALYPQGFHTDESQGDQWCAVANTPYGLIPAVCNINVQEDRSWYIHNGQEIECKDFTLVKSNTLSKTPDCQPHGKNMDGTEYWCVVAETDQGKICGMATKDGKCLYSIDGKVHESKNFMYVIGAPEKPIVQKAIFGDVKPQGIDPSRGQNWCAMAKTVFGMIPGKVYVGEDKCYYTYDGKEHSTGNFVLVKSQKLSDKPDDKPQGAEKDKKMWCAVADTANGTICGKADDKGNCWFPRDTEHKTKNFKYVLGPVEGDFKEATVPEPQGF